MTSTPPPLTLDEARRRTSLLHVDSYLVELDLTRGDEVAGSRSTVVFRCAEPGAATFAEITARELVSASLNGTPLPADAWDGHRLALDGLADSNELVVEAEIEYDVTGDGLYREVDPADGEVYVGAYVGVANAQLVFACFDQPDLKAEITTRVVAPPGWTVVGNGRVVSGDGAGGVWQLATTPRISPYLFVLAAGPFAVVRTEHRGLPMAVYARRANAAHLHREAEEILDITRSVFDRCGELFVEPYPFDKYDQAFVPGLNWGALEQVGCILLREEYLFTSEVTREERLDRANTIAHEMSHMWFGDLMTLHWWDDVWLNESFAEYMGARLVDEATSFTGSWERFAGLRKPWGYAADDRPSTHPVAPQEDDVRDTERALENFDGISYAKGAAALRQLVAWLGDDVFLAGVNALITERRYATARLHDFLAALSRASGRDVHGWAEAWLRTSGHDTLRLSRDGDELTVEHAGVRPHLVVAGLYDEDAAGALVLREEVLVRLEPDREREPLPYDGPPPAAALVCHRDLTFAGVRHDSESDRALRRALSSVTAPLARIVVWDSWRDQVRHGELSPLEHLERVRTHLRTETEPLVVEAVLDVAQHLVLDRYLDGARRPAAAAALHETCEVLLATAESSGDASLRLMALRGLVDAAGPEQVSDLRAMLPGVADDDELRWRVVTRLAALGGATAAEVEEHLALAPTHENSLRAVRARASRPDPAAKAQAWELITATGPGAASTEVVRTAASGFWVPGQAALLADYLPRFLPAVIEVERERGAWLIDLMLLAGWPWHVVDLDLLEHAEAVAADPACSSTVRRHVGDSAYDYRQARTSQERWLR